MKRILSMLLVAATVISMMIVAVPASAEEASAIPDNYEIGVDTWLGTANGKTGNVNELRSDGLHMTAYNGLSVGIHIPLDSVYEEIENASEASYEICINMKSRKVGITPYIYYGFGKKDIIGPNEHLMSNTMNFNNTRFRIGNNYISYNNLTTTISNSTVAETISNTTNNVTNASDGELGGLVEYKFKISNGVLTEIWVGGEKLTLGDTYKVTVGETNTDYFGFSVLVEDDSGAWTNYPDFFRMLITDVKITSNEKTKYEVDFVKTYAAISTVSASAPRAEYAQMSDDGTSVRFVAGVTMTEDIMSQFTEVGFDVVKVEGNNTTHKLTSQKLYTSIKADAEEVSADKLNADYISAMSVDGLSKTQTYRFAVRGFLKDKFGNIFAGDTNYFEVVNGEISTSTPAEEDIFTTVKVGTYNLHEGGYYELGAAGTKAPDFTKIAEDIKDLDVVAFQEIYCNTKGVYGQDPLAIMEAYLESKNGCEYYYAYGVATTVNYDTAYPEYNIEAGDVGRLGVGIISKYPIKKTNEYKMTVNNSENNCVLLEAIIDVNGTELAFYSTHNDQSAIDVQLSEIYTQAKNYSRYIVAGDFNYQTWTGFDAAFPDANKVNNAETHIVTTPAGQMFDNIIYSDFTKLSGTAKAINTGNSDHYLLTAEIKVLK